MKLLSKLILKFRFRRKIRLAEGYLEYAETCNESDQHKNMALYIAERYTSEAEKLKSQYQQTEL